MTLNCHICKKELELLDGNFICPDGHVSHYTQEVMEEDQKNISERSRKIHTKNQEPTFLKVYKFFTMMYIKMKNYLEIESDLVFKLMLTYHHGDSIEIFTFNCLYTVLYYSLRAQREQNYLTLCKEEFETMFSRSYYMNNFNKYINEYNLVNNRDIFTKFMLDKPVACVSLLEWMKLFGNVCYKTKGSSCFTPSILQKENLEVKRIFRAMVRRDEKMMQLYLEKVCDHLGITCTKDMECHFHRLCDFFFDSKRVFMPDLLVCLFLYLYAARNDLEIDVKRTEERLCYKEDIIDLFRREINEQIFMVNTKADLGRFRIYQKEYSVEKTFKPLCKFKKKLNMLKYIFSVYMHSTEDTFMWLVNCMAIFMDYACVNNLQQYLENEMKVNLELLNGKVKAVRCQSEEVQARRKERKIKAEEKINEKKENRAIKNEERRKMRKNKTEKSAHQ